VISFFEGGDEHLGKEKYQERFMGQLKIRMERGELKQMAS